MSRLIDKIGMSLLNKNPQFLKSANITWEEIGKYPKGHIFEDFMVGEVRVKILKGPHSANGYVGVPIDSELAGYYDISLPNTNGDVTYAGTGMGEGMYWYGWDYSHEWDATYEEDFAQYNEGKQKITIDDIKKAAIENAEALSKMKKEDLEEEQNWKRDVQYEEDGDL